MENGEEDSANKPMSAFDAMRKRFEQQEQNNAKPAVTPKPGKLGGGNELNIFATKKTAESEQKPGINKPGNIGKIKAEPVSPRENSPSGPVGPIKKRNSSISIPAAFSQESDSPAPPLKPKPKVEPKSKSDANNNPDKDNCVSPMSDNKPKISAMKPETKTKPSSLSGNTSPRDGTKTSPRGGQVSAVANAIHGLSPGDLKRNLKPVKKTTDTPNDTPKPVNFPDKDKPVSSAVELRQKFERLESKKFTAHRRSVKSVIRTGDNKKFRKNDNSFDNSGEAPVKPEKLDMEIDIDHLIEEFQNQLKAFESVDSGVTEIEEEEDYDDVANYQKKESRAISLIAPMTEEDEVEEEGWKQMGLGDATVKEEEEFPPPPEDLYDDGITPVTQEEEGDELYEALPEDEPEPGPPLAPKPQSTSLEPPAVPELKTRKPSEADSVKESKESEKERKKKEKEERIKKENEEKAQKKKEKELKAFLNSYSISAEDLMKSEGKGKVKKTAKASNKKCLAVQEGDKLDIIRMINKGAKGKWLVRIDTTEKVGYVESDNIELMVSKTDSTASPAEEDQEMYEAVDGEDEGVNGYEEDEIYEECN